ncbi:hypothetical protein GCM10011506_27990 [Marivirga lumbricoides]|uniref:DUF4625 domain-containing protein n=1 Tax=Marivirga lumbricoides TaxID=1046115 RepID=A0ABQ1MHV9_9BACT|nr:hypothetical protein GCM10011506_27990 [Marivirga lumbricoides]
MKLIKCLIAILFFAACNDKKEKVQEMSDYIDVLIDYKEDTIESGDSVYAKIYLNNDQLYEIALKNNIHNYLSMSFWDGNDNTDLKYLELKSDTGYIKFLPEFPKDSSGYHYWQFGIFIKFTPSEADYDTAFVTKSRIFIK